MPIALLLQAAPPSAPADDPMRWVPFLVAGAAIVYMLLRNSAKKKRREDPMERAGGAGLSLSQQRNVEREMQHLLVELSQMARQLTAQLDTRSAKLELLIKEADDRLEQLKAASGQLPAPPHDSFRIGPPTAPVAPAAADLRATRHAEIYSLQDAGRTPFQIAEQLGRPAGEIELILALRPRE